MNYTGLLDRFKKGNPMPLLKPTVVVEHKYVVEEQPCKTDKCKPRPPDECQSDKCKTCRTECSGNEKCHNDCISVDKCRWVWLFSSILLHKYLQLRILTGTFSVLIETTKYFTIRVVFIKINTEFDLNCKTNWNCWIQSSFFRFTHPSVYSIIVSFFWRCLEILGTIAMETTSVWWIAVATNSLMFLMLNQTAAVDVIQAVHQTVR